MKRTLRVMSIVFLFLAALSAVSAGRAEAGIVELKIIGIIDSGGVKDYKAILADRVVILKTSERHEVGDVLHNFFGREEVDEYGLPVVKQLLRIKNAGYFHDGYTFISIYPPDPTTPMFFSVDINGDSFAQSHIPIVFSEGIAFRSLFGSVFLLDTKRKPVFDEALTKKLNLSVWDAEWNRGQNESPLQMRFSEGLAPVYVKDESGGGGTFYIMNKSGDLKPITQDGKQITSSITDMRSFSEGMAWFRFEYRDSRTIIGSKFFLGLLDSDGRVVKTKFEGNNIDDWQNTGDFHDGLAIVSLSGGINKKFIAVDKAGNTVLDLTKYNDVNERFSDGLLGVQEKGGNKNWAYIDTKGKQITNFNFNKAEPFSEGLAAVTRGSREWGYINKKGEPVINFQFSEVKSFSEGLAAVKVSDSYNNRGWTYIDKTGKAVIEPRGKTTFSDARSFSGGYALVKTGDGKWAYIDTNGDVKLWFR